MLQYILFPWTYLTVLFANFRRRNQTFFLFFFPGARLVLYSLAAVPPSIFHYLYPGNGGSTNCMNCNTIRHNWSTIHCIFFEPRNSSWRKVRPGAWTSLRWRGQNCSKFHLENGRGKDSKKWRASRIDIVLPATPCIFFWNTEAREGALPEWMPALTCTNKALTTLWVFMWK